MSDVQHIDDWLDEPILKDRRAHRGLLYAKFVLELKRWPAWKQSDYEEWINSFTLFCKYDGSVYRCTGASRMGDVWLHTNLQATESYTLRVNVNECSEWSNNPNGAYA